MNNLFKQKLQLPVLIYVIVYIYLLLAIGINVRYFLNLTINDISIELLVAFGILFGIHLYPIQYETNKILVTLGFLLPVMMIYGLVPILLMEVLKLFLPTGQYKKMPLIKRIFNYANQIVPYSLTYYFFIYLVETLPDISYKMLISILIATFFLVVLQMSNIALVVYIEKKYNIFKTQYLYFVNIFLTNATNGIITYYLYQALGMLGVFVSVLYAILFSKLSKYQAAYDKKTEELREAEHRAKLVFDTVDYGVIMLDREHRILSANPVAQKVLYILNPEPIGKVIEELDPQYSNEIFEIIGWSYKHKKNFEQKSVRSIVRGEVRYYDMHTYPQLSSDGEMVGLIWVYKNVTEEHLIRSQLVDADKLTRLGQIAAGKVHEIKNPLTTVRGYLQFLKQKVAKGDTINLNSFDIALQEIDRTNEIISSLLILSKQTNNLTVPILLDSLVEEVVHLFQHQFTVKNISFYKEFKQNLYVNGVENHLKQILINLFLNAIDALIENKENPQIKLQIRQEENKVLIEFSDNGLGISEENLAKLHVPFFTTKEHGTGLGLSVTYKLIEEHRGTVEVLSKVGLGTTFFIRLPLMEQNQNAKAKKVNV